jgi:hypothetical protein
MAEPCPAALVIDQYLAGFELSWNSAPPTHVAYGGLHSPLTPVMVPVTSEPRSQPAAPESAGRDEHTDALAGSLLPEAALKGEFGSAHGLFATAIAHTYRLG